MALVIRQTPTLKNKEAKKFLSRIEKNASKRATVSFHKEIRIASEILKKANMK